MDIQPTLAGLSEAFSNNNPVQFSNVYNAFLSQNYERFNAFRSDKPAGGDAQDKTEFDFTNPLFGLPTLRFKHTTDEQAQELLRKGKAANAIFNSLSIEERKEFLEILKEKIHDHKDEIALTISADTGKPFHLSKSEMEKGGKWFDYAHEEMSKQLGEHTETVRNISRVTDTISLGVAQVIGAYNYPYALAISGVVGALAGGNSVVISPPLKAPNWIFPFMEAAHEAVEAFALKAKTDNKSWASAFDKVKDGLIQNSMGVNSHLTANADVVHFVGGDATGAYIRDTLRPGKPTILEMGGSNVVTVLKDALEDKKAQAIAEEIFGGVSTATGQRCTAPRILCVEEGAESVSAAIMQLCEQGVAHGKIGNPFDRSIKPTMGPLVDDGAYQKMQKAIAVAKELGAPVYGTLDVGENTVLAARNKNAHWVNPIVIDWSQVKDPEKLKQVHDLVKDEIFGPLLHIIHPVKNLEQAIAITNELDATHKLAGAIYTSEANQLTHGTQYLKGTNITSLVINGIPRDQSPYGEHGHYKEKKIGGPEGLKLYVNVIPQTYSVAATQAVGR